MTPEQWNKLAGILLFAGILLLIAAVILSVRFHLISLLRAELKSRKDPPKQDYFAYVKTKEIESLPDEEPVQTLPKQAKEPAKAAETVPADRKAAVTREKAVRAGTVLAGAGKRQRRSDSGTLVVSEKRRQTETGQPEQKFIITENIVVMSGDPAAVSGCRTTTRKGSRNE